MDYPRTGEPAPLVRAYTALTAAARINTQWHEFAPFIVSFRSTDDDREIASAMAEEGKLARRTRRLQARVTNHPNDRRLQRSFEDAADLLEAQKSVVAILKENRSCELQEIAADIKSCLLKHNYEDAIRIPDHSVITLEETDGVRHVGFIIHPAEISKLMNDKCFAGHTLTRVMPPHLT